MNCPFCDGTGYALGAAPDRGNPVCGTCQGLGTVRDPREAATVPNENIPVPCPLCRGRKKVWTTEGEAACPRCGGSGAYEPPPAELPGKPPEPPAKAVHPWLKAKLYEPCHGCAATGKTTSPMMVDRYQRKGADGKPETLLGKPVFYSGSIPIGSPCPLCEGRLYVETGLSVGQVERFRAMSDVLLEALAKVAANSTAWVTESGFRGFAEKVAGEALAKCGQEGRAAFNKAARLVEEQREKPLP